MTENERKMIYLDDAINGAISIQRSNGVEIYSDKAVPVEYLINLPSVQPDNSCDGCRYENADDGVLVPCGFCKRSHPDNYERRTDD